MLIDNWFVDSAEGTLILFIRRKWSNCYDYHFDNKSSFSRHRYNFQPFRSFEVA